MEKYLQQLLDGQRQYFFKGFTKDIDIRVERLKLLKDAMKAYEPQLIEALEKDLGKSEQESLMTEIHPIYHEIDLFVSKLKSWSKPKKTVDMNPLNASERSVFNVPKGVVLILSTWNLPVRTSLIPLIGAVGAGNCVILKPPYQTPAVSSIVRMILDDFFERDFVAVVEGGDDLAAMLSFFRFDMIFMTGSQQFGKTIMKAAAEHLTPVVSVTGGKNPCIVDKHADIRLAAKRIIRGKMIGAGQTSFSPDYIYAHEDVKEALVEEMKKAVESFYGNDPITNDMYPRVIDLQNVERLIGLLQNGNIRFGGYVDVDLLKISPTIIDGVDWHAPIMKEEILGPILPVMTYGSLTEVMAEIESHQSPLALYLFTTDDEIKSLIMNGTRFGLGCINDTVLHLTSGQAHVAGAGGGGLQMGHLGYECFSDTKSVIENRMKMDMPWKYPSKASTGRNMVRQLKK